MPAGNQFRHQSYPPRPVFAPEVLDLLPDQYRGADFTRLHTEFGVRHVELVHGTFSGDDPFGISAWLRQSFDEASPGVRAFAGPVFEKVDATARRLASTVTAGVANFSEEFRAQFESLCGGDPKVSRLEPAWSGENHHLARAVMAVKMLVRLHHLRDEQMHSEHDRILLWGHSHAGNGFAILTNLLANDRDAVTAFFDACGEGLGPEGEEARHILSLSPTPHPMAKSLLIATFGTPVRYGWDTTGCRYLMHVSHHRPFDPTDPARAKPAITVGCEKMAPMDVAARAPEILLARQGDWVQLFALAGTDLKPTIRQEENAALGKLLEAGLNSETPEPEKFSERFQMMCPRWKTAPRAHSDGRNLLVQFLTQDDMKSGPGPKALLGHAVYISNAWMEAQLGLILDWLRRDGQRLA